MPKCRALRIDRRKTYPSIGREEEKSGKPSQWRLFEVGLEI